MTNPYAPPTVDMSPESDHGDTYLPSPLALRGRIGRVRWLAYSAGLTWISAIVIGGGIGAAMRFFPALEAWNALIAASFMYVVLMMTGMRRLNDMNHSAWWTLLTIVPIINTLFWLWLLFARGTEGRNHYGPAPMPNTRAVIAVAWLVLGLALVGIVAALAIPAYQDYTVKAKRPTASGAR